MPSKNKNKTEEIAEEFEKESTKLEPFHRETPIKFNKVLSTGSTLLDLNISGKRVRGGGIPGGIVVETFGPAGIGKTALLAETATSAQINGGDVQFKDPEARLDKEYSRIYGMEIDEENYSRPDTVTELFDGLWGWKPKNPEAINVVCADSLASLSTDLELKKGDKMGMRRAKEFSEGLRKTCRMIASNNWLIMCSNQIRQGDSGITTPGGHAVPFYSSLRIQLKPPWPSCKIEKKIELKSGKEVKKIIGVASDAFIYKSSLDDPFRTCPIYLLFGLGIDDIRANLQWYKDMTKETTYNCIHKSRQSMEKAIDYIEENDLEGELRERIIDLWEEIEHKFDTKRKRKVRR